MLKKLISVSPLILLFLSLTPLVRPQYFWQFELTVITTEYAHWLAAICLLLLLFFTAAKKGLSSFILVVSLLIFSIPTVEMFMHFSGWKTQLDEAFGNTLFRQPQGPDFKTLWTVKPELEKQHESLVFRTNPALTMDFYRAKNSPTGKSPWILVVPGGGWTEVNPANQWQFNSYFAQKGYAVAVVPYRILPQWRWPSPREDVTSAIAYIKAHAQELRVDPLKWVIVGRSAGGQIAQSIAYENPPEGLRGGVFFYSPADMNYAYEFALDDDILKTGILLRDYMSGKPGAPGAMYDQASPIRFVNAHSPPTLMFHGPRDPLVWYLQSERLLTKLTENKVPSALIRIPWATHGFDYNFFGPGGQISTYAIERFIGEVLKK
jgi:acetyl esterase/lipase